MILSSWNKLYETSVMKHGGYLKHTTSSKLKSAGQRLWPQTRYISRQPVYSGRRIGNRIQRNWATLMDSRNRNSVTLPANGGTMGQDSHRVVETHRPSKRLVSRIYHELDTEVERLRARRLDGTGRMA